MHNDPFFEEGTRVLTPTAFQFVLDGELRRAVRSQNFLTLVVLDARREWEGMTVSADDGTVDEVAELVGREVRESDVLGHTDRGTLALVLLDSDFENSTKVIDRLIQRINHYDFPTPLLISVGAACYPTHAVDAPSLKEQAASRPVANWRRGSNAGLYDSRN